MLLAAGVEVDGPRRPLRPTARSSRSATGSAGSTTHESKNVSDTSVSRRAGHRSVGTSCAPTPRDRRQRRPPCRSGGSPRRAAAPPAAPPRAPAPAARVAVHDRDRRAPVPLARDQPVVQAGRSSRAGGCLDRLGPVQVVQARRAGGRRRRSCAGTTASSPARSRPASQQPLAGRPRPPVCSRPAPSGTTGTTPPAPRPGRPGRPRTAAGTATASSGSTRAHWCRRDRRPVPRAADRDSWRRKFARRAGDQRRAGARRPSGRSSRR